MKRKYANVGEKVNGDFEPGGLENPQTHCVYQLVGWFETLAKNTERI